MHSNRLMLTSSLSPIEYVSKSNGTEISFKDEQLLKTESPINVKEGGIEIYSSDEQLSKTLLPISVKSDGHSKSISAKLEHP